MEVKFDNFDSILNRINELLSLNIYDLNEIYNEDSVQLLEKSLQEIIQYKKDYIKSYFKENYL